MSQETTQPELIPVSVAWSKPRSIATLPPGQDTSPSKGYLLAVCHRYPFIHLSEERQSGVKFLPKETMQQAGLEPRISISRVRAVNCSATHTTHVSTQKYVGNINFCTADPDPGIFVLFSPLFFARYFRYSGSSINELPRDWRNLFIISNNPFYSQTRSSITPKNTLMNLLFESWLNQ